MAMPCDRGVGKYQAGRMEAAAGFLGITYVCVQIFNGLTPGSVIPLLVTSPRH